MTRLFQFFIFLPFIFLTACQQSVEEPAIIVSLIADGRELTFQYNTPVTVEQFLTDAEIELGDEDRVVPQLFTQISDGMRVTVRRVRTEIECEEEIIPYEQRIVPNEGLEPDEQRLAQSGENGVREVCYQIIFEDEVRQNNRILVGQPTVLTEPKPEIIFVGPSTEIEPIPIVGTLAYINNGNAWAIRGNSTEKRPLTVNGDLDSFVFSLSPDGNYLLYTTEINSDDDFFNQLWITAVRQENAPVELDALDVLYAEWVPGQNSSISYSTGEVREVAPFWKALNNLWIMEVDLETGSALNIEQVLEESLGGLYGWWGTTFQWSPDGQQLAWVRADSMGLVDFEAGSLQPLLNYPVFNTTRPWSWRAGLSWSWDGDLIATTVHGPPIGSEPAENSPVFNVTITNPNGNLQANVVDSAGIWASPKFSVQTNPGSELPNGYIGYLRARRPHNSVNGEYDLVVADRDGSNARAIFPDSNLPGITSADFGLTAQDFAWSPDGKQIAVTYQGNLWVVDVESAVATQLTFDFGASNPIWSD